MYKDLDSTQSFLRCLQYEWLTQLHFNKILQLTINDCYCEMCVNIQWTNKRNDGRNQSKVNRDGVQHESWKDKKLYDSWFPALHNSSRFLLKPEFMASLIGRLWLIGNMRHHSTCNDMYGDNCSHYTSVGTLWVWSLNRHREWKEKVIDLNQLKGVDGSPQCILGTKEQGLPFGLS